MFYWTILFTILFLVLWKNVSKIKHKKLNKENEWHLRTIVSDGENVYSSQIENTNAYQSNKHPSVTQIAVMKPAIGY